MANKKYWQSFGELNNSEAYEKSISNEFKEELPFESADKKGLDVSPASRRDFLKYLGFSTAAAIVAASCETKVNKAIPYVNKPQDMVPGVADYYATTYVSGGESMPVVAKVVDGRPIKLEGNTLSKFSNGGSSARMQASVLDLGIRAAVLHGDKPDDFLAPEDHAPRRAVGDVPEGFDDLKDAPPGRRAHAVVAVHYP